MPRPPQGIARHSRTMGLSPRTRAHRKEPKQSPGSTGTHLTCPVMKRGAGWQEPQNVPLHLPPDWGPRLGPLQGLRIPGVPSAGCPHHCGPCHTQPSGIRALGQALLQEATPCPFATSEPLREPGSPSADLSERQAHLMVMATWTSPEHQNQPGGHISCSSPKTTCSPAPDTCKAPTLLQTTEQSRVHVIPRTSGSMRKNGHLDRKMGKRSKRQVPKKVQ